MATYTNFYETINESHMRLKNTVVMYDGYPHYVWAITDHKKDEIFRVYLEPLPLLSQDYESSDYFPPNRYCAADPKLGPCFDEWLEKTPQTTIIRKQMNSPLFNKFRPFELGMCNMKDDGQVIYLERSPLRSSEQGLTSSMVIVHALTDFCGNPYRATKLSFNIYSEPFTDCVLGKYPHYLEAFSALKDTKTLNSSIAFHRKFAISRGPANTLFLCYKTDVVGLLSASNTVSLSAEFSYLKEVVENLGLFKSVLVC